MSIGGVLFMIGAGLQAGSVHLGMLIAGRIMLGVTSMSSSACQIGMLSVTGQMQVERI